MMRTLVLKEENMFESKPNRKLIIEILIVFLFANTLYANDTSYIITAAGGDMNISKQQNIVLENEALTIKLFKNHYEVAVRYLFKNISSSPASVKMSFPEFEIGDKNYNPLFTGQIETFLSFVSGAPAKIEINDDAGYIENAQKVYIRRFFTKEIAFNANEKKDVINTYTEAYSAGSYGSDIAAYLYGTASAWGGTPSIKVTIDIEDASPWVESIYILANGETKKEICDLQFEKKTISFDIKYPFETGDALLIRSSQYGRAGILFDYDPNYTKFNENDIQYMTASQLRILRNFIYAWHGKIFDSKDLNAIFMSEEWYIPKKDFKDSDLSDNEVSMLKFISTNENNRR
jgi:hypothetical protein